MLALIAFIVGIGVAVYACRNNPKGPKPMTEEQLRNLGYTTKEAQREARAQRNEARSATRTTLDGIKAGSQASRAVLKIGKKL
jgi:hypothetical protein